MDSLIPLHSQHVTATRWRSLIQTVTTFINLDASIELAVLLDSTRLLYNRLWLDFIALTHEAAELWDEVKSLRAQRALLKRDLAESRKTAELAHAAIKAERSAFGAEVNELKRELAESQKAVELTRMAMRASDERYVDSWTARNALQDELNAARQRALHRPDIRLQLVEVEGAKYVNAFLPGDDGARATLALPPAPQPRIILGTDFSKGLDKTIITVWQGNKIERKFDLAEEYKAYQLRKAREWQWHLLHTPFRYYGYPAGRFYAPLRLEYTRGGPSDWLRVHVAGSWSAIEARVAAVVNEATAKPSRHGKPWGQGEDRRLVARYEAGKSHEEITRYHEREPEAILYRLAKLAGWGPCSVGHARFLESSKRWFFDGVNTRTRAGRIGHVPGWARR